MPVPRLSVSAGDLLPPDAFRRLPTFSFLLLLLLMLPPLRWVTHFSVGPTRTTKKTTTTVILQSTLQIVRAPFEPGPRDQGRREEAFLSSVLPLLSVEGLWTRWWTWKRWMMIRLSVFLGFDHWCAHLMTVSGACHGSPSLVDRRRDPYSCRGLAIRFFFVVYSSCSVPVVATDSCF